MEKYEKIMELDSSHIFKITLKLKKDEGILIRLEEQEALSPYYYEKMFTKKDFIEINKVFRYFDSLEGLLDILKESFEEGKVHLEFNKEKKPVIDMVIKGKIIIEEKNLIFRFDRKTHEGEKLTEDIEKLYDLSKETTEILKLILTDYGFKPDPNLKNRLAKIPGLNKYIYKDADKKHGPYTFKVTSEKVNKYMYDIGQKISYPLIIETDGQWPMDVKLLFNETKSNINKKYIKQTEYLRNDSHKTHTFSFEFNQNDKGYYQDCKCVFNLKVNGEELKQDIEIDFKFDANILKEFIETFPLLYKTHGLENVRNIFYKYSGEKKEIFTKAKNDLQNLISNESK